MCDLKLGPLLNLGGHVPDSRNRNRADTIIPFLSRASRVKARSGSYANRSDLFSSKISGAWYRNSQERMVTIEFSLP
jgi:hypothetical protein